MIAVTVDENDFCMQSWVWYASACRSRRAIGGRSRPGAGLLLARVRVHAAARVRALAAPDPWAHAPPRLGDAARVVRARGLGRGDPGRDADRGARDTRVQALRVRRSEH